MLTKQIWTIGLPRVGDRGAVAEARGRGPEAALLHSRPGLQGRRHRHREHRRLHRPEPQVRDDRDSGVREEQVVQVRDPPRSHPDAQLRREQPGRRLERKVRNFGQKFAALGPVVEASGVEHPGPGSRPKPVLEPVPIGHLEIKLRVFQDPYLLESHLSYFQCYPWEVFSIMAALATKKSIIYIASNLTQPNLCLTHLELCSLSSLKRHYPQQPYSRWRHQLLSCTMV